jgi:hypothetical protein
VGEIKGSAFIFRVNGLKVVGQKNGRKDSETRFLTRVITLLDVEDFLLIIATTTWLSTLKIIRLFFKCIPQMCTEMTTGKINSIADALSRSDWQRFKTLCPEADPEPTEIPDHLWKICSEN